MVAIFSFFSFFSVRTRRGVKFAAAEETKRARKKNNNKYIICIYKKNVYIESLILDVVNNSRPVGAYYYYIIYARIRCVAYNMYIVIVSTHCACVYIYNVYIQYIIRRIRRTCSSYEKYLRDAFLILNWKTSTTMM